MAVGLKSLPRVKTMKRQIQARTYPHSNSAKVLEHTPIYDLEAYEKRVKKRKNAQFYQKIINAISLLCMFSMTFSILFMGE